jgi:protein-S-isoprenylcysteine O-methyltransferase Ste14
MTEEYKMDKKTVFAIIVVITIVLYALLIVNQTGLLNVGDVFGYIYYVLIAVAVIAAIWLLVGKRGKSPDSIQAEAEK